MSRLLLVGEAHERRSIRAASDTSPTPRRGAIEFALRNLLRSATWVVLPLWLTRRSKLSVPFSPCEQPAPASSAYKVPLMNATSPTPETSFPNAGEVSLEGKPPTTVLRTPCLLIFEMRAEKAPLYGPAGEGTCWQSAVVVVWLPPSPPSATYRSPFGPNAKPRGFSKPVANVVSA